MKKVSFKLENRILILLIILLLLLLLIIGGTLYVVYKGNCKSQSKNAAAQEIISGYYCKDNTCYRAFNGITSKKIMGLSTCFLTCIPSGTLWPKTESSPLIDKNVQHIDRNEIKFINIKDHHFYENLKIRFYKNLDEKISKDQNNNKNGGKLEIFLNITEDDLLLNIDTKEKYDLNVIKIGETKKLQATISADNYFGARNGLETLLNLIVQDELTHKLVIPKIVLISDQPHYKHRGLLIDTITNYIPIENITKTIDIMSRVKLNVLHWYIGGAQSFPLYIHKQPKLNEFGRYSKTKIYTSENIIDVVNFAKERGIRVIPEFDTPANIGAGWETSNVTIKCDQFAQLNLINEKLHPILDEIFGEIRENFQSPEFLHLGGRNVSIECWKKPDLNVIDNDYYIEHWKKYLQKIVESYEKFKPEQKFIIWKETFDKNSKAMEVLSPEKVFIQTADTITYNDTNLSRYKFIISKGLNIDFTDWRDYFIFNQECCLPCITIEGAEALLWTRFTDEHNLDQKLWPKLSAVAEKLWKNSNPNDSDNKKYLKLRLLYHRTLLVKYGVQASAIESEWCLQNMAECDDLYT